MMRNTGLGSSAVLVAVGAVLAWAVTYQVEGIDLNQVGVILFIVGLVLGAVTFVLAALGRKTVVQSDQESIVEGQPVTHREREVVSRHDVTTGL